MGPKPIQPSEEMVRLARVFPRHTRASPDDALAFFGPPPFDVEDWHLEGFARLKPRPVFFFAYDDPDRCTKSPPEAMRAAAAKMLAAGFTAASHRLRTFVFIGFPQDTFEKAEARLREMVAIGFTPYAILWQPETPSAEKWRPAPEWKKFQRSWARPACIYPSSTTDHEQTEMFG